MIPISVTRRTCIRKKFDYSCGYARRQAEHQKSERAIWGAAKRGRKTTMSKNAMNVMREHGAYPLDDTLNNDSLLEDMTEVDHGISTPTVYIDNRGIHLVWYQIKKNANGEQEWHDGRLELEAHIVDIDKTLAGKLDYIGEAPDFNEPTGNGKTITDDVKPDVNDSSFLITGYADNGDTYINSILVANGDDNYHMLKDRWISKQRAAMTHLMAAAVAFDLDDTGIMNYDNDAILQVVKELVK